jgi:HEAT repeat protein
LAPKKKWSQALTKLLLNTRANARIGAIGVLGIWRDDRFFDLLVGRMSDADANARAAAINAVSRHTHKSVVRELATHLEDPDATVRIEAVAGLGRVPNGKVQEVLHRALYDEDAGVRTEAMVQMHRFSADPRCALKVSEFLVDSDEGVREATALTLLRLKDPRTFNTMRVHLKKEKSVEVRLRLIAAIAQSNPRKAAPLLIRLLAKAKGREVGVIAKHLTQLSGKELGLKAAAWKEWWKGQTGS